MLDPAHSCACPPSIYLDIHVFLAWVVVGERDSR